MYRLVQYTDFHSLVSCLIHSTNTSNKVGALAYAALIAARHIVRPVQQLTKKDTPFVWTPECIQAIRTLKRIVSSDPVLRRPDHERPFELEVDASQYALGAILYQRNDGGKLQAVGYYLLRSSPKRSLIGLRVGLL